MTGERTVSFVTLMAAQFPALGRLRAEHVNDNVGETLPHVFLGDVTRHVLSLLDETSGHVTSQSELHDILQAFEDAYTTGDEDIQELIVVSFLEHLPYPGETGAEIRDMLGPNLRRQLRVLG